MEEAEIQLRVQTRGGQAGEGTGFVLKAQRFAAHKHRDQRRKDAGASPYINHPIAPAETLWTVGRVRDSVVLAPALLHDTIEDTETTAEELRGQVGEAVCTVVEEVTDVKWLRKGARKRIQVARPGRASKRARLVKLADKICNLEDILARPPGGWALAERQRHFDWAREVVDQVRRTNRPLERRFDTLFRQRPW